MLHAVLDTGTPEKLNHYINMQQKKKNTENDNKSKFLRYCFQLAFLTCENDMSNYLWGCKIRLLSVKGPRDKLGYFEDTA